MLTIDDQTAVELLERALPVSMDTTVEPREGQERPDLVIEVNGARYHLELRSWGRTEDSGERSPGSDRVVVWILKRGAPEIHRKLRDRDASFVDLTGTVRLHLPGLLIDRGDLEPVSRNRQGDTRNPFADRASRILRVLFETFPRDWSIQELAKKAGVSLGLASYVVRSLSRRELVAIEPAGREKRVKLSRPESLVAQWTAEYTWRKNESVAFRAPIGDPERFLRRLPKLIQANDWALTLQAGASLVAARAAWNLVHLYVPARSREDLIATGIDSGWVPGEDGKVVLMRPHYRESFDWGARRLESLPVVSDLQLILDLWHYPVRGREQAEAILDLCP